MSTGGDGIGKTDGFGTFLNKPEGDVDLEELIAWFHRNYCWREVGRMEFSVSFLSKVLGLRDTVDGKYRASFNG